MKWVTGILLVLVLAGCESAGESTCAVCDVSSPEGKQAYVFAANEAADYYAENISADAVFSTEISSNRSIVSLGNDEYGVTGQSLVEHPVDGARNVSFYSEIRSIDLFANEWESMSVTLVWK